MKWFFRGSQDGLEARAGCLSFIIGYLSLVWMYMFVLDYLSLTDHWISFLLPIVLSVVLGFFTYKQLLKYKKEVDSYDKLKRQEFISKIDLPVLALDFYEAVFQKYRYTNYEEKLSNHSDWVKFQTQNGRISNERVEVITTYDKVLSSSNKFLERLFSKFLIEIMIFSKELEDGTLNHLRVHLNITLPPTHWGHNIELRYSLDEAEKETFKLLRVAPFYHDYSVGADDLEDNEVEMTIKIMKKFIKKTRKLVR